jgi:hypothetical protein
MVQVYTVHIKKILYTVLSPSVKNVLGKLDMLFSGIFFKPLL